MSEFHCIICRISFDFDIRNAKYVNGTRVCGRCFLKTNNIKENSHNPIR